MAKVVKKRTAQSTGQRRGKEVLFRIKDPASAAPLSSVAARDDLARTQKLRGSYTHILPEMRLRRDRQRCLQGHQAKILE